MNILQRVLVALLRAYQVLLSPVLAACLGPSAHCRFQPTCSRYALEAVRRHGALRGAWLAVCRVARCHPWGKFGEDPVPAKKNACDGLFKIPELGRHQHGS